MKKLGSAEVTQSKDSIFKKGIVTGSELKYEEIRFGRSDAVTMKLINVGFGNMVSSEKVVALVSPEAAPVKRIVQEAKEKGLAIDATQGKKTLSVIICDSDHVVLSAISCESISNRINEEEVAENE